jgi:hypothetical protein
MFISPYFGGCKYTNYFLFINKNIEFQRLVLLITSSLQDFFRQKEQQKPKPAAVALVRHMAISGTDATQNCSQ